MSAQQFVRPPLAKQLIKIGTSGIVLPGAKRDFPPEYQSGSRLNFYGALQLGEKSGCILIQFPASIRFSHQEKVAIILQRLNELNLSGRWSLAIEVRHASWYQPDAYALFEQYNTALVFHDMPGSNTPWDYVAKHHVYCRFHGPTGNYAGSYAIEFIQRVAEDIKMWRAQNKIVYAYFNNTMEGALENAQALQRLIQE